jgi:16S rRNA C1402 N4-methylase RsmH
MEDIESLNSSLSPIVEAMKEKFLKYWEEVPAVIIIANYLYSSFKKKYTVNLLQRYKQKLRLHTNEEENRVNNLLEEMFNIYNYRQNANNPSSTGRNIIYAF